MCLCNVFDNTIVEEEGEAYKNMWRDQDGRYHSEYNETGRAYVLGTEYEADTRGVEARLRQAGMSCYTSGYHCWKDLDAAHVMFLLTGRGSSLDRRLSGFCNNFSPVSVVVRVKYRIRLAVGDDNPFGTVDDPQFPCVVVDMMTIMEEVNTADELTEEEQEVRRKVALKAYGCAYV